MDGIRHQTRNSEFSLRPHEIRRLIRAAATPRDRLLLAVLAYTGMRRAEVTTLRVADIDTHRQRVLINHGKGGKRRIVFLPEQIIKRLRTHLREQPPDAFVFAGRHGQQMSLRNVNLIVAAAGRSARVHTPNPRYKGIGPHLLRHSFARNWKRAGGSLETLQKLLGHTSLKTTLDTYGTESQSDSERNYRTLIKRMVTA